MNITRSSLDNPVALLVAIILLLIFGSISLSRLPIQLTPELEQPEITITTSWRAASPNEVEAEIVEPQEDVLRGLPGLTEMRATAYEGRGEINLTFTVEMDMRRALIEVMNRLNQVPDYPDDADEPSIKSVGQNARAIAWFMIKANEGNERPIESYKDYVEEIVQSRFERVPGVARSEIYGGSDRELRITFDPYKVASLGIELEKVMKLAGSSKDISAGFADVGKREYSIRFAGKYVATDLGEMILEWRDGYPIYLRDVATIEERLTDKESFVLTKGSNSIAVNAQRETGVNVLQVMSGLHKAIDELNDGPLKRADLSIEQVHDETIYIHRSIEMLRNNLGLGIALAIIVLFLFLLKFPATLVVAASIPICLIASFSIMDITARTINIISLAGLAFAVGMVLDASIVILENIVRLREKGLSAEDASIQGTSQVYGALLASTATTIAIFLPIVFLRDEVGQLFSDLAITITAAIAFSLLTAITVVPTAAKIFLARKSFIDPYSKLWKIISGLIMTLTNTPVRRALWIVILISIPVAVMYILKPKADYLPDGNQNLAFAFILPPPGTNIETLEKEMGQIVAKRMQPYSDGTAEPHIYHYFFVAFSRGVFMGARAKNDEDVDELVPLINSIVQGFPDSIAFAKKASLFRGFGSGRTIDINLQSRNLPALMNAALSAFIPLSSIYPNTRPLPGLELAQPELRLIPNERRISEAGWDRSIVAAFSQTLGDGRFIGDYFNGEETLDIILRAKDWDTPEELAAIPIMTINAGVLPLNELVDVVRTAGPEQIRRINRRRTVTLEVSPPPDVTLEDALEIIKKDIEPLILAQLPEDGDIQYGGTADKLTTALENMLGSFLLAITILYLLMSAMFRSFKDSLLVMLAIPLATFGGVLALYFINLLTFQPMDLLTMIGFIILLGLVVNNAILLVHQARLAEREGHSRKEAVEEAVLLRLRPIMMSTMTSIFGMLPLLLIPGAGTELYRGLAGVIVGGMMVSTFFTLILLPSLLRIGEGKNLAVR
ncbi:MAG: efflux RND transporter permease subunit [Proteobacteria bacterium]|nr:efflux RND transporter permease subunit [Pseudomonadota bacterium]NOG60925.1 efflux RND transporter permease subunit [Pseudomonadota bacterium]